MYKIINLTPEKNASRSIGDYINEILNTNVNCIDSYGLLTETEWLDFDNVVNESIVFMFVRNPYDRLVSSFIHMCLSLDYVSDYPEWYFDLPINKENQLKCFKKFCLSFAKDGGIDNQHIKLQTKVIDEHVKMIDSKLGKPTGKFDNFSIIPYIENEKIFIGKVESVRSDIERLVSLMDDNMVNENAETKLLEHIGNNSEIKFSNDYKDWYDTELYDLMTPVFKKELEIFDYEF
jgi:hypothetical protein